jgi:hypothetical protein
VKKNKKTENEMRAESSPNDLENWTLRMETIFRESYSIDWTDGIIEMLMSSLRLKKLTSIDEILGNKLILRRLHAWISKSKAVSPFHTFETGVFPNLTLIKTVYVSSQRQDGCQVFA